MVKSNYNVIGVMSGTSLDGIDLAHLLFAINDGYWTFEILETQTVPYTHDWVNRLKNAVDFSDAEFVQQLLALRVAVALCHARRDPDLDGITLCRDTTAENSFVLTYRSNWAQAYPQSAHLLAEEAIAWQKTPWALRIVDL